MDDQLRRLQKRLENEVQDAIAQVSDTERSDLLILTDYALTVTLPALAKGAGGATSGAAWRLATAAVAKMDSIDALMRATAADPQRERLGYRDFELFLPAVQTQMLLALEQAMAQGRPAEAIVDRLFAVARAQQKDFMAQVLPFEAVLRTDPAGVYPRIDARSRRMYRDAVFAMAKSCNCAPSKVVGEAVNLARAAQQGGKPGEDSSAHIGFYLLDDGRNKLREALTGLWRPRSSTTAWRLVLLVMATSLVALLAASSAAWLYQVGELPPHLAGACVIAWLLLAYDYFGSSVHRLIGRVTGPRGLVAIDYSGGLPASCRTVIAVPCLLVDTEQVDAMLDAQGWNFAIVNDTNVSVALLTDFPDSVDGVDRDDELHLLAYCVRRVEEFNRKYARYGKVPMTLLHRARTYSQTQRAWIGEERKRGKLEQLHRLIGGHRSSFECVAGNLGELRGARFVLCLDEDNRMQRNALHTLVGALDHPLNRAVVDPVRRRIVRGHGLLASALRTRAAAATHWRLGNIVTGLQSDEHDTSPEVREFHFDYLGFTHYPGKGLYEVAVYDSVCSGRLPSERILSHDTMEGAWLRPGFASRTSVVEAFPSTHRKWRARQLRWIVGDWQNLWLLLSGSLRHSKPPIMLWYTVLNQVRISLTPVAIVVLGMASITGSSALANQRLLCIVGLMLAPVLLRTLDSQLAQSSQRVRPSRYRAIGSHVWSGLLATGYRLLSSLDDTWITLRAIATSAWRWALGRNMLAWRAAALVETDEAPRRLLAGVGKALLPVLLLLGLCATGRASAGAVVILLGWSCAGWLFRFLAEDPKLQSQTSSQVAG